MEFLRTKRLILRNVEDKDIPIMFDYRNHELCARYQRGQVKTYDEITALVHGRQNDVVSLDAPFLMAAALKESGEMVGEIVVMPNDGAISLGYTFSYKHHRRGYAFEALSALTDTLHERFPDWEFISFTEPENAASIALLKKLGYQHLCYSDRLQSEVFGKWVKDEISP